MHCTFSPLPDEPLLSLLGSSGLQSNAPKNRVGKNLFSPAQSHLKRAAQPAQMQQEKRVEGKKIASGAPHYRARCPSTGRFISRDPLDDAELSQKPNSYFYVQDNPSNDMDPSGLNPRESNPTTSGEGQGEGDLGDVGDQIGSNISDEGYSWALRNGEAAFGPLTGIRNAIAA